MPTVPITPPIPATPGADSPLADWDVYLRAVQAHNAVAQIEVDTRMVEAQNAVAAALTATAGEGFSEAGVLSLVSLLMRLPPAS